jgi:hypothetical protein
LAIKKILWTIQEDESVPINPCLSRARILAGEHGNATDHDYRNVDKYDKAMKTRREESEQAISILEKSIGPVPLSRIDEVINGDQDSRTKIKNAYDQLMALYGTANESLVDEIEDEFHNLPAATTADGVIKLLDKMVSLNAELRHVDRESAWSGGVLKKFLNKRVVNLPAFASCKDRCALNQATWAITENEFRLVAERECLTSFSVREAHQTSILPTQKPSKRIEGQSLQEFTSTIAAALAGQISSSRACWNCSQSGHYLRDCRLGMCRTCSTKGDNSNHNPIDCPNYVSKSREQSSKRPNVAVTNAYKGAFKAKIHAAIEDDQDKKRPRHENDDQSSTSTNATTLWDMIKAGITDETESNYESSYQHPLILNVSEDTAAKLTCSSLSHDITADHRVLLDSGASISLCTILVAERSGLKVNKLKKPIALKFAITPRARANYGATADLFWESFTL